MKIRPATELDLAPLAAMRAALWPDDGVATHARELQAILDGAWSATYPYVVLVAETEAGLAGFADVTVRSRADGCDPTRPAGYLEGWYVAEEQRRRGIGAALMRAAEDWARAQGCTEMASDTWLDNEVSQRAHQALGYEVVDRVVTFRKALLLLLFLCGLNAFARDLVLHGVTVIDGAPRAEQDVVIRGEKIVSVAPHRTHPKGAEVTDGTGRYVIPGLVDMHVHLLLHPWDEQGEIAPRYDRDATVAMLELLAPRTYTAGWAAGRSRKAGPRRSTRRRSGPGRSSSP